MDAEEADEALEGTHTEDRKLSTERLTPLMPSTSAFLSELL